jgi:hypothetical protein
MRDPDFDPPVILDEDYEYEQARQRKIDDDGMTPSISAVGKALIALEEEAKEMEVEAARHYARYVLAVQKQCICFESIKKLLEQARSTGRF